MYAEIQQLKLAIKKEIQISEKHKQDYNELNKSSSQRTDRFQSLLESGNDKNQLYMKIKTIEESSQKAQELTQKMHEYETEKQKTILQLEEYKRFITERFPVLKENLQKSEVNLNKLRNDITKKD